MIMTVDDFITYLQTNYNSDSYIDIMINDVPVRLTEDMLYSDDIIIAFD